MTVKEECCKSCKHFRQHYVKMGRRYSEVFCGHCVYPRLKTRKPDAEGCKYYKASSK